jgi:hypothetical protein
MTDGEVVAFDDDPAIEALDPVWRRIPPDRWTYDHNENRVRPVSNCFKYSPKNPETNQRHPMSVVLGKGLTPEVALGGEGQGFKLVGWTAGHLRGFTLGVCSAPRVGVAGHGLVFTLQTDNDGRRKSDIPQSVRKRLAESAQWITGLTPEEVEAARLRTAET